ncbi:head outer capsid protein [Acinetobacter phage KARL-1]|uniref:Highly immunogenic outer capsid protein n=1 Tax=Acinetobacter phage KARL-1 TaxID=2301662 RepID=A0A385IIJ9_9CAUD|nr:Hoc-like head decoration [Acinetobacter phage KARL-1]AXY82716.1 head outer capsid protein [Acinetobacter phage KARL-1]
MATTLQISPVNPSVEKGKTQKFTATVTGAPEGSTVEYKWEVDGVAQTSTTNTLDYVTTKVGTNVIKVTSTTKVEGEADDVKTATTNLTVTKITQTTTGSIATSKPTINFGESYTATATVAGQPAGATITYLWSDGSTTATTTKTPTAPGTIKLTCKITVKASDYTDKIIDSNELTITVNKTAMTGVNFNVLADSSDVKVGDVYSVDAIASGGPAGVTYAYAWNTGETTAKINVTASSVGTVNHECTLTATHANYLPFTVKKSTSVNVSEKEIVIPEDKRQYVHPLPHRNSAYIWAGWWVMDEIEKITKTGGDWKQPPEDNPYYYHLLTLAKMLVDFPEVDVQESRHGRIVHRSALDTGIIY